MLHAKVDVTNTQAADDDRRAGTDRVAIDRPSTVRLDDFHPRDVIVEDLSSSGFRFRSDNRLTVGTRLHVGLGGGGMSQARVVRADDGQHGCEFTVALTDEQLARAFKAGGVVAGGFSSHGSLSVIPYRDDRWPGAVRVVTVLGGATLSWAAIWLVATRLIG